MTIGEIQPTDRESMIASYPEPPMDPADALQCDSCQ